MNKIIMFETSWCPYCKQARKIIDELLDENPSYKTIDITIIDEELQPELSKQFNYYYVPTFYLAKEKLHEGVPTKEIIRSVFDKALLT